MRTPVPEVARRHIQEGVKQDPTPPRERCPAERLRARDGDPTRQTVRPRKGRLRPAQDRTSGRRDAANWQDGSYRDPRLHAVPQKVRSPVSGPATCTPMSNRPAWKPQTPSTEQSRVHEGRRESARSIRFAGSWMSGWMSIASLTRGIVRGAVESSPDSGSGDRRFESFLASHPSQQSSGAFTCFAGSRCSPHWANWQPRPAAPPVSAETSGVYGPGDRTLFPILLPSQHHNTQGTANADPTDVAATTSLGHSGRGAGARVRSGSTAKAQPLSRVANGSRIARPRRPIVPP